MKITKADVIDSYVEIVDALTAFADREDREIELIVRTDGTAVLMGSAGATVAGEPATAFDPIKEFDCFEDLWMYLQMAEAAA
jgi:hypothetical protein